MDNVNTSWVGGKGTWCMYLLGAACVVARARARRAAAAAAAAAAAIAMSLLGSVAR
jgi:hypothetical protein